MAFPKTLPASGALDMSFLAFALAITGRNSHCWYHNGVRNASPRLVPIPLTTVFLDRDGVINKKMPEGRYVTRWEEFELLPGVVEAIDRLNRARIRVLVVSNQRGIAKELYSAEDLRAIHEKFQAELAACGAHIDGFYFCPHDKNACDCRKPLPGMFQ